VLACCRLTTAARTQTAPNNASAPLRAVLAATLHTLAEGLVERDQEARV
jgi:hypothetical protein